MKIRVFHITILALVTLIFTGYLANTAAANVIKINSNENNYILAWPGILPDNTYLFKLKVLRNKLIPKLVIQSTKRLEFDLLMADKTLLAAKMLQDKGNYSLALETALKGENYFSVLAADYGKAIYQKNVISSNFNKNIDAAYIQHQKLISYLITNAKTADLEIYKNIDYFSDINYQAILSYEESIH